MLRSPEHGHVGGCVDEEILQAGSLGLRLLTGQALAYQQLGPLGVRPPQLHVQPGDEGADQEEEAERLHCVRLLLEGVHRRQEDSS